MAIDPFLIGENLVHILDGEKTVFLRCDPAPTDFTKPGDSFLSVATRKASMKVPLKEQVDSVVSLLSLTVFAPGVTVVAWDIKPVLTYCKWHCLPDTFAGIRLDRVYDLKLAEAAAGSSRPAPASWTEAVARLKACTQDEAAWRLHRLVHLPLALRLMPAIETCGVVDDFQKKSLYPSYTVEGQVHGRMSCQVAFPRCVNPHSLDAGHKAVLVPKPPHDLFVQFDYQAFEVRVLQWLSKDPVLGGILADPKRDVYQEVFKAVADSPECGPEERSLAKRFFLPVFFGQGAARLAESLGVGKDTAAAIIEQIGRKFPVAWGWADAQHRAAEETGWVSDVFGRRRQVDSPYIARHNNIAAPAALVSLHKLVRLHDALDPAAARVVFSIHDGYLLATRKADWKAVAVAGKKALEAEDPLYPGLVLKTSCEAGKNLGKMMKVY